MRATSPALMAGGGGALRCSSGRTFARHCTIATSPPWRTPAAASATLSARRGRRGFAPTAAAATGSSASGASGASPTTLPHHQPRPAQESSNCQGVQGGGEPQQQAADEAPEVQVLKDWIEQHGGWVHPALRCVPAAPCGTRGIVATAPVPLASDHLIISAAGADQDPVDCGPGDDEDGAPMLVVVPEDLYLTTSRAATVFAGSRLLAQASARVPAWLQLAAVLAHERSLGAASFWYPYVQSLPPEPPCAWLMGPEEVDQALVRWRLPMTWRSEVERAGAGMQGRVGQLLREVRQEGGAAAAALRDVSEDDLVWAVGQVVSRCFGGGTDVALAPFIDLLNHGDDAPKPRAFVIEDDRPAGTSTAAGSGTSASANPGPGCPADVEDVPGALRTMVYVPSMRQGQPVALRAGDEVLISYASGCPPLQAFLNFGFVPPQTHA